MYTYARSLARSLSRTPSQAQPGHGAPLAEEVCRSQDRLAGGASETPQPKPYTLQGYLAHKKHQPPPGP